MSVFSQLNLKIKKMDWLDLTLVKFSSIVFGVLLVILIPALLEINIWWLVVALIVLAVRPAYRVYLK